MAIASLSTLSTDIFKGGRGLTSKSTGGLVTKLNLIIAKVNEIISGIGTSDTLDVGSGTGVYYGASDSWMTIDGTNPPTVSAMRWQDQDDGGWVTVTLNNGTFLFS